MPLLGRSRMRAWPFLIWMGSTLAYVIGVVVRPHPWWEPQYLIPIAGMILGNSVFPAARPCSRSCGARSARR
jgi:putative ABC transport system permease protein